MKVTKLENGRFKYEPENWVEHFKVMISMQIIDEGCRPPFFYLAVRRHFQTGCYEAWIFPLAIPVIFLYIFIAMFGNIWRDLITVLQMNEKFLLNKSFKKIPNEGRH